MATTKKIGSFFPSLFLPLLAVCTASCATAQAPRELVDARAAYSQAAAGPAAQLKPAELHVASDALAQAEKMLIDQGDTDNTRDRSYIAAKKAELAASQARTAQFEQGAASAQQAAEQALQQAHANTKDELKKTKEQLAAEQAALATEQSRRMDAEKRANQAAADLARIAAVKQEPRGTVITLSGSVLFASNKYELLPAAQAKLSEVATALLKSDPDSKMVVEGHTDSQGNAADNQTLSQNRAESVRSYLVSHGIAADRITAQGIGATRPIADNTSAEGRANNRRVEIIIQPATTR